MGIRIRQKIATMKSPAAVIWSCMLFLKKMELSDISSKNWEGSRTIKHIEERFSCEKDLLQSTAEHETGKCKLYHEHFSKRVR